MNMPYNIFCGLFRNVMPYLDSLKIVRQRLVYSGFICLLGVWDWDEYFSLVSFYYYWYVDFIQLEGHLFCFCLRISTQILFFYELIAKLNKLYGLVNICNYHKCFIFSMHWLKHDCCVLAYFYAAVGQLQLKQHFLQFYGAFSENTSFTAWQFLELRVNCPNFLVWLLF